MNTDLIYKCRNCGQEFSKPLVPPITLDEVEADDIEDRIADNKILVVATHYPCTLPRKPVTGASIGVGDLIRVEED